MIRLRRVAIHAGEFWLRDVGLEIPDAEYAVLMGRTGSGKTTLLESICGLRRVVEGRIEVGGRDVTSLRPAERGVGYVPQDGALFPAMSVRRHLTFALEIRRWNRARTEARLGELSDLLALRGLLDRAVPGLSGGERQRVALGRALSFGPRVLLLDEPLSALDEESRQETHDLLKRIQKQEKITVLHVTHSSEEAAKLADRHLRLDEGRIREGVGQPG